MDYLIQGGESSERINLLLSLTKISSDNIKQSLTDYYCQGVNDDLASLVNDVKKPNFVRAKKQLNKIAGIVEEIKELDCKLIS